MKKNRSIGLISAVPREGSRFIEVLHPLTGRGDSSLLLTFSGKLFGCSLHYMVSGMGKVNAAHAATLMINKYAPSLIINFGIGGAYPSSGLAVGDAAIATKELYVDEGIWLDTGLQPIEAIGIPLVQTGRRSYYSEFPLVNRHTKKLLGRRHLKSLERLFGMNIMAGPFATVSACTGTAKRAAEIEGRFGVICENMEGAAIAQISALYGIPLIEVRGISNIVEKRNRASWDIPAAAEHCQQVVMGLLQELSRPGPAEEV